MTTDETVCGYTNYDTFTVAVIVDNDYDLYLAKMRWFNLLKRRNVTVITRALAKRFATEIGATTAARTEDPDVRIRKVDWDDIADSWQSDYEEFLQYDEQPDTGRM